MRIFAEHVYDCPPEAFWAHHLFGVAGMVERLLAREVPLRQEHAMSWFNANLGSG